MIVPGDACAELQIIATDGRGLSVVDRATIREAAEAYQDVCRQLAATQRGLEEAQAHREALRGRILDLQHELTETLRVWAVPSWMRVGR